MQSAFKNKQSMAQCLANELLMASNEDSRSFALRKKEERKSSKSCTLSVKITQKIIIIGDYFE